MLGINVAADQTPTTFILSCIREESHLTAYPGNLMTTAETAPILSTPDSHIFQEAITQDSKTSLPTLLEDDIRAIFEIDRTVTEILNGKWQNVALQFPDDMLSHAPRVFELLRDGLVARRGEPAVRQDVEHVFQQLQQTTLSPSQSSSALEHRLTILADTSYGACCVDEIAAEHVDAQVVVHYGRTCLSPTARLPVIYVFTLEPIDLDSTVAACEKAFPDKNAKVIVLADVPYQGHVDKVSSKLQSVGFSNLFTPSIIHDPASAIPNRTLPRECEGNPDTLKDYAIFHISDPPPALLLNLASRVSSIHIFPTSSNSDKEATQVSSMQALRRRYALVTRLSTVPIFGILINTLSVKNYMGVLQQVKDMISNAGKKYYTFVVGKVNAAKVANFSEVGGWVVIGCWESSLIESKEFWKPIITPFELKLALMDERDRVWTGEWNSNFQAFLDEASKPPEPQSRPLSGEDSGDGDGEDDDEDEPPVFDLRTGRYVSQTRPMSRPSAKSASTAKDTPSTSLIRRANGDLAQIGGQVSPAAEFLRSKRTWQGLGSDHEIAYQFDDQGKAVGAQMEQGRDGIARGYAVGEDARKT